jgi:hypothetical protein
LTRAIIIWAVIGVYGLALSNASLFPVPTHDQDGSCDLVGALLVLKHLSEPRSSSSSYVLMSGCPHGVFSMM